MIGSVCRLGRWTAAFLFGVFIASCLLTVALGIAGGLVALLGAL